MNNEQGFDFEAAVYPSNDQTTLSPMKVSQAEN